MLSDISQTEKDKYCMISACLNNANAKHNKECDRTLLLYLQKMGGSVYMWGDVRQLNSLPCRRKPIDDMPNKNQRVGLPWWHSG